MVAALVAKFDTDIYNRQEVADRYTKWLHEGVPTLGWAGDSGLRLVFAGGIDQRWELWTHAPRVNEPDYHLPVFSAPPGAELNDQLVLMLIRRLVANDTHRRGNSHEDQLERVFAENDRMERVREEDAAQALHDPLARFYHEAGKVFGVTKTFFPFRAKT